MKKKYYVLRINDWYVRNVYGVAYVSSTQELFKAKRYKTFKAASKLKDRLDAYYESEGIKAGRDVIIIEVELDIKLRIL